MKVTVTIDPHFQEEGVAITAPQPSERIQKVQQFIEELDQKERLRAKKDGGNLSCRDPLVLSFLY